MKKFILVVLLLTASHIFAQTPQATITFSTIAQMQAYGGSYPQARVLDTMRGGVFNKIPKGILPVDSGVVFNSGNANYVWVRDYTQKRAVNVRWWGAIGNGLASYKKDSAAITMALRYLNARGGGSLYFPSTSSFYGFNGMGILVPDNIEIFGDGAQSEIKHVNPESTTYFPGCIFFTGTYGSQNPTSIFKTGVLSYTFKPISAGANYIVLNNIADTSQFQIGEVFVLGSDQFFKKADTAKKRYLETEMIEVAKINLDTVFTTYALTSNYTYDAGVGSDPLAIEVNSGATTNTQLGVPDHCTKNVSIHDLTLSQADYNMIANTPYSGTRFPFNVIGLGETFNSQFYNLNINGLGTFGGNMYNQCNVHDLVINGAKKLFDFGYGTANSKFYNIKWTYLPTAIAAQDVAFIYWDDAMHNCEISNISAVGQWSGNNVFQITGGAYNLDIHDITFNLPNYNEPERSILRMDDDGSTIAVHDISMNNIKVNVQEVGQWIKFTGDAAASNSRNISFNNFTFTGVTSNTEPSILLRNTGNIEFTNSLFSSGDTIETNRLNGAVISNIQAPNAILTTANTTTLALYNNNFKSSDYAAITPIPPSATPSPLVNGQLYNNGTHLYIVIGGTPYQLDQQGGGGGSGWLLTGNSGTNPPTDFIGTTDSKNLIFRVNNNLAGKLDINNISASFGEGALSQSTGSFNSAFGANAANTSTTGGENTAVGNEALVGTTAGENTSIGSSTGAILTTGSNNTMIGFQANGASPTTQNSIALGSGSIAKSYQFALPDNVTNMKWRGVDYVMPSADGSSQQLLTTDGSGNLSWSNGSGGGGLFPTSGTGTATADVTGDLDGYNFNISSPINLSLSPSNKQFRVYANGGDDEIQLSGDGAYSDHFYRSVVGDNSSFTQYNNRYIFGGGNVGIGVDPSYALDVNGGIHSSNNIVADNQIEVGQSLINNTSLSIFNTPQGTTQFKVSNPSDYPLITMGLEGSNRSVFVFDDENNKSYFNNQTSKDHKVGFNEDAPTEAIDVDGNINLTSNNYIKFNSTAVLQSDGNTYTELYNPNGNDGLVLYTDGTYLGGINNTAIIDGITDDRVDLYDYKGNKTLTLKDQHLISNGSAPSITFGSAAGEGASGSVSGNDVAGTIVFTTGSIGIATGVICQINYVNEYPTQPIVVFSPANANAGRVKGVYVDGNSGSLTLNIPVAGLLDETQYKYTYHVIGIPE